MDFLLPIFNLFVSFLVFHETKKEIQHGIPGAWLGYFTALFLATLSFIGIKQINVPTGHELVFTPIFNIFFKIIFMGTLAHFIYLIIRFFSGFGGGPKRPRSV